jgi:hypothetical protein
MQQRKYICFGIIKALSSIFFFECHETQNILVNAFIIACLLARVATALSI